jgi:hypothetical protein
MTDYEGKDGLERDYYKLRALGATFKTAMAPHVSRFRAADNLIDKVHTFTNLLTEGCRASPYFFAHVFVWPLIILNVVQAAVIFTMLVKSS